MHLLWRTHVAADDVAALTRSIPSLTLSMQRQQLIDLRAISLDDLSTLSLPTHIIQSEHDVDTWKSTRGYKDYALYLRRLSDAVVGYYLPLQEESENKV